MTRFEIEKFLLLHASITGSINILDDGTVNVYGDISVNLSSLQNLPIQFGFVTGIFSLKGNSIKTLKGIPNDVNNFKLGGMPLLPKIDYLPEKIRESIEIDISWDADDEMSFSKYTTLTSIDIANGSGSGLYLMDIPESIKDISINYLHQLSNNVLQNIIEKKITLKSILDESDLYYLVKNYIEKDDFFPLINRLSEDKNFKSTYENIIKNIEDKEYKIVNNDNLSLGL